MLTVTDIQAGYAGSVVLDDLSIEVGEQEVVCLLGSNGAGKTTLMRVISGLMAPYSGSVVFDGEDVTGLKAHDIAARGLIHVPELRRIFPGMTVLENLEMGGYMHRRDKARYRRDLELIIEVFPRLGERRTQLGGTLSGGEQQMLAIARGLMSRPRLMLVDEPSLGLAPLMVEEVFRLLRHGWDWQPTLLIAEQNAMLALQNSKRGYVVQRGRIELSGSSDKLLEERDLFASYLGEDDAEDVIRESSSDGGSR